MALRVEKQRADPGEGPSSQRTYQLPALDLESADWRRLSDEISDGKTDLVQIVESPAWHDAQEQTSQNVGSKQKATDPASSKTEVPSPSEQTPETVLKRFRPAHFSQPYRDQQEFDIMSRGFFGKQPELNLRYKASSYDPESSSRLNEQKSFFDAPPSEETEFHDQVYRSLTKYLAECKRNSTMNLTAHASPQIPPSNDNHMRKDSKWADGGVPPNFQDNESVQESAQIPSSLEDGMGDTTMSTLKNALPFLESSGDQSTIKAAKSHRPNLKSAEQAGFRHSSYEGNTSSMGSAAGGPMPRATNSHRPQAFRHSEIPHGSYSPMMTGARPKAMDKRSSTAEGKAANSAKLVPYGTGQAPIDIFTYDAHKSARPTMHRAPGSPNSEHTMEGKKVTSKGVNMSGALGVPPTLLRPKQAKHGSFSSSGDQRKARDNPSPQCVSGASAEATHTTPPKEIPRKPVGTANQEPDVTLLKPLKHATPSVQEGKREKGLKKFVGKLAKKASTIGNENGSGSILARHPSPYPFIEDIEPKKDLSLPRKLSRKLTKKSREDLQFQSHIHPALRTAPQHVGTKDRSKLVDNDQNDESLRKWKESLGLGTGEDISDPSDPRKVIIQSLGLEVEGRPDIIIDLTPPGAVEALKDKPFTIKEGAKFRMKATFKVQHQILSGMKYIQSVKRHGIGNKIQEMIGSYSPNTKEKPFYEKKFESDTAPTGMIARGHYNAVSKFVDDDNATHLKFEWSFDIKKDW